jgi:hypothetical protein
LNLVLVQKLLLLGSLLAETTMALPDFFYIDVLTDVLIDKPSLSDFFTVSVKGLVVGAIWENVISRPMFLTFFPVPGKTLAVWVKEGPKARANIIFEFTVIDLAIWPKVFADAVFFVTAPFALVNAAIWPNKEAKAMHGII